MEPIVISDIQKYKRLTYLNFSGDDDQDTEKKIFIITGETNINPKIRAFKTTKNANNINNINNNNGGLLELKNKSDFNELNVEYKDFEFTKLISEDNETNCKIENEIGDSPEFCTNVFEIDPTLSLTNLDDLGFLHYDTKSDNKCKLGNTEDINKTIENPPPLSLNFQLMTIVDDEQYQCDFVYESFYKDSIKNNKTSIINPIFLKKILFHNLADDIIQFRNLKIKVELIKLDDNKIVYSIKNIINKNFEKVLFEIELKLVGDDFEIDIMEFMELNFKLNKNYLKYINYLILRNQKLTDFLLKSRINYKKVLNDSMVLKDDFLNKSLLIINSEIERNSKLISSNLRPMDYELAPNYQNKLDDNWSSLPILDTESQDLFKNTDLDKIDVDKKFEKEIRMRTELINASSTKKKRKEAATKDEKEDADNTAKKLKSKKEDAYNEETQTRNAKPEVEADADEVSEPKEEEEEEEDAKEKDEEEADEEEADEEEADEEEADEEEEDEEEENEALDIMRSVTEKEDEEEGTDLDTDPGTDLGTDVDSEDE